MAYLCAGRFRTKRVSRGRKLGKGEEEKDKEEEKERGGESRLCNEIARSSTAVESNVRLIVCVRERENERERREEKGNDNIRLQTAFRLARSLFFSDCARTIRSSLKRTT